MRSCLDVEDVASCAVCQRLHEHHGKVAANAAISIPRASALLPTGERMIWEPPISLKTRFLASSIARIVRYRSTGLFSCAYTRSRASTCQEDSNRSPYDSIRLSGKRGGVAGNGRIGQTA